MKGIFITGTDTGVGKTVATATLCRILRSRGVDAVALKPFATGISLATRWQDNDPLVLSAAMDYIEQPQEVSSVNLSPPLSPYDAARVTGINLDFNAIIKTLNIVAVRHSFAIIEGVGGVCVPITDQLVIADFIKCLDIPALVVARSTIGTINHSLLTIRALRQSGVDVNGVVFMRAARGEFSLDEIVGPETACRFAQTKNFGLIDYSDDLNQAQTLEDFVNALPVNDPTLMTVATSLIKNCQMVL